MAQIIKIGNEDLSFPDSMGREEIRAALSQRYAKPQEGSATTDLAASAASGVNSLVPSILGLPVDTATNIRNLGTAAYGTLKSALTPEERTPAGTLISPDLPDTVDPASQTGGSQWFKDKISGVIGDDVFSPPDPSDPTQQKLNMAGSIVGSSLLSPAAGIKQAIGTAAKMTIPAAGAVGMQEAFPDQPLAPMVGAMGSPLAAGALAKRPPPTVNVAAEKANSLGLKVLPKDIRDTGPQDVAQGTAGTVPLKQLASKENQPKIDAIVRKDLDIPDNAPLSVETLQSVRAKSGEVYESAKNIGSITADKAFIRNMDKLKAPGALAKDFPNAVKKDMVSEVGKYNVKSASAEGIISAMRSLRRDADAGFGSTDPQIKSMARTQKKIADQLEGLLGRAVKQKKPGFYEDFVSARRRIAKTYTVQKALKGESVDAVMLGKALVKNKPMSDGIKDVAEFGRDFGSVAQVNPPQVTNFRPMDWIAGAVGGMVRPELMALVAARPALRKLLLTKKYQDALVKLPARRVEKLLTLPKEAQAGALIVMLGEDE
ncbi:hypothetical protein MNBD_ALPHA03-1280 [hydrothermal vent metagenome]|uniref:Uncharacterized protein n=1 Tax=hydrothermal vent metagenome TaxID=652676 RepID=A0A3B1B1J3_9ZZZZ